MHEIWHGLTHDWLTWLPTIGRLLLIGLGAWLLRRLLRALFARINAHSLLPPEIATGLLRVASFMILAGALLMMLETLGVSATVLWTAFTGFAAVAAVAFFAAWSVLSNIFCTLLIATTRPFRLHDHIELLEGGDKPGLRGQVIDVNLIYTTLREPCPDGESGPVLQIPNSLFFQRTLRRWPGTAMPPLRRPAEGQEPAPGTQPGWPSSL